jgi:hypothetical protein
VSEENEPPDVGKPPSPAHSTPPAPAVLEYAGPRCDATAFRLRDHPVFAAGLFGALAAGMCQLVGGRSATVVLTIPLGALFGVVAYSILTAAPQKRGGVLALTQLIAAMGVALVVVLMTFVRGAQESGGPGGLRYWLTYNPGYRFNPRWAMQDVWIAAVAAAWFLAVAGRVRWRNLKSRA